jgi:O-antigen/teichoic acid export membrane protein
MSNPKLHVEDEPRQYFANDEAFQEAPTSLLSDATFPGGPGHLIRGIGLNTFYQVGAQLAPAIAAIAAIPVLLRYLGTEAYGIVTLFSTALIYFTMLDLGLGRASTRFISQSLEARQPEEVRRYFWSSILLLTGAGIVVSLCFLFAVPSLVSNYLKVSPAFRRPAIQSFQVISVTIPLVTLTAGLRGFLEASGRFPFLSLVTVFTGIGMYVLPVLVVMAGGGLVWIATAYVLVRIGLAVAFATGCLRVKGRPSLRPALSLKAVRNMVSFGGWLSVSNVVGTAMVYGDRFLLGSCVGMVAVASYSMPLDVIGRMQIVITSFCAVLFPLMSRLDGSRSEHFQTVYRGAVAIVLSLLTPMIVGMILLSPFMMKIWLRARNTQDAVFSAEVFLAGSVVQAMASISFTALHARGRSDLSAWVHMAEFPIYCAAFYWAAMRFGVRGAALVWLGRTVVDFICMAVSLQIQERGRTILVPEMAAALVSIGILVMVALKTPNAALLGGSLCIATWLWSWRVLLDSRLRTQFSMALGTARSVFGEMVGTTQNR